MTAIVDNTQDTQTASNTDELIKDLQSVATQEVPLAGDEGVFTQETKEELELPSKFKGKNVEDIVRSYEELEKQFGKQGQELGELRKLTDEFIRRQLLEQRTPNDRDTPHHSYEEEPDNEVDKLLQKRLEPILSEVNEIRKEKMTLKLNESHPDFVDIIQDKEFIDWVKASKVRTELYLKADQTFDYESADELFSVWKDKKNIKTPKKKAESSTSAKNEESFRAAKMETGGSSETAPKKIYRRADIIALKMNDPYRYEQLQNEIMTAYAEGRVR